MKKTLSLLIAIVMVLGLFPALAIAEEAAPEKATIKIMGYERKIDPNTFFSERDTQEVWKAAEKLFADNGIELEFEIIADQEQYKTTIQTRLASNYDLPDVASTSTMTDAEVMDLAQQGIILPMSDILELTKGDAYNYFNGGEGERARNTISSEDGKFYWLPRIQVNTLEGKEAGTSMGICIRYDWLQELGLEMPKTLDEFTAALRAFQENDMNKNGVKDEVLAIDPSKFTDGGISYWFGMVNEYVGVNVNEGTVESPWYSPHAKEYFAYMNSLVEEGLLYEEKIGSDSPLDQLQNENKVSALYYYPIGTYVENPMRTAGYDDAYYLGIPPFNAVEGVEAFYSEETPYLVYLKQCVTNAAQDKQEAIARMYDTIYSEEFIDLMDYGVEGSMYEVREDGQKVRLTDGMSFEEQWNTGLMPMDNLARHFFPTVRHNERLLEIEVTKSLGWEKKGDYEMETADYAKRTPNDNTGYYALSTTEETAVLNEKLTDLETFSRELASNLILGQASLDDWDTYIEELKDLGLDEVIAIRQAQLDRRNGK